MKRTCSQLTFVYSGQRRFITGYCPTQFATSITYMWEHFILIWDTLRFHSRRAHVPAKTPTITRQDGKKEFLQSLYSFTIECNTLSWTVKSPLLFGKIPKVIDHSVGEKEIIKEVMQCRFITMYIKIQQITKFFNYFSPDFTFFSGLIQLVWSIWELPNLNTSTGQRDWICLGLTITLKILCCRAKN